MKDKKKIRYAIISIIVLMITITSSTYAYFAISASNSTAINGTAANVGLVLSISKITPETSGTDTLIPQLESALGTAISNQYKCIDDNNNTVCQVYKASLTNNGNATVRVKGTIAFSNINNIPHLKWKLIDSATSIGSNTGTTALTTATNFITEITINANQTEDYYFVVWIDETGSIQNESGTFTATLTFTDSNGRGLTSTIGAVPASNFKYTVNTNGYVDTGSSISPEIVLYDTPQFAMAAFDNNPFYLKHTIENNIVTESYVEFVVTPEMASANPGMTAGTYALRGYTDGTYYQSNVNVLKQAFGENSGYCNEDIMGFRCEVSRLGAYADSQGYVYAGAGTDPSNCYVREVGSSSCFEGLN